MSGPSLTEKEYIDAVRDVLGRVNVVKFTSQNSLRFTTRFSDRLGSPFLFYLILPRKKADRIILMTPLLWVLQTQSMDSVVGSVLVRGYKVHFDKKEKLLIENSDGTIQQRVASLV